MNDRTLSVERSTSTGHRLYHYDGACGNIHGHNMRWEVEATVSMKGVGPDNMPVDLKDISDKIDTYDHALLLNRDDPLFPDTEKEGTGHTYVEDEQLGDVYGFNGDPTCETVAQYMADLIHGGFTSVKYVEVTCYETDKYGITATAGVPR